MSVCLRELASEHEAALRLGANFVFGYLKNYMRAAKYFLMEPLTSPDGENQLAMWHVFYEISEYDYYKYTNEFDADRSGLYKPETIHVLVETPHGDVIGLREAR